METIQDYYPSNYIFCYGCGAENPPSHCLKSYMLNNHTEASLTPDQYYSAGVSNNVYREMIASLLDCRKIASTAAFAYRDRGRLMGDARASIRFVTASFLANSHTCQNAFHSMSQNIMSPSRPTRERLEEVAACLSRAAEAL